MPESINQKTQKKRRREACQSVWITSAWLMLAGVLFLVLRYKLHIEGFAGFVMIGLGIVDIGMIIPIWILLKMRLKEIEGGEEDAASKY